MRCALRLAIQRVRGGGPDDGGHRQLGHGDVIRVAVCAIRAECEHDLRPRTANRGGDAARGLDRIGAIELFVGIPEQEQFVNAERRGGRAELAHANGRQGLLAGVQRMVLRVSAVAARFAVGGRDHRHRRSLAGIPRQRGAEPERLIVRVGDDGHETERGHGSLWSGRPRPFGRSFPRARNYKRRAGCRERCVILALPRCYWSAPLAPMVAARVVVSRGERVSRSMERNRTFVDMLWNRASALFVRVKRRSEDLLHEQARALWTR